MIAHHEGAIDMARTELEHGSDAEAKRMAQKVIDESTKGVAELRAWPGRHGGWSCATVEVLAGERPAGRISRRCMRTRDDRRP